jgi:hypothetical protein
MVADPTAGLLLGGTSWAPLRMALNTQILAHEGEIRRESRKVEAIVFTILFIQGSFHPLRGGFSPLYTEKIRIWIPDFLLKLLGSPKKEIFICYLNIQKDETGGWGVRSFGLSPRAGLG